MKKAIHPVGAAAPVAPYTPAIEAHGTVYLSGQIALVPGGSEMNMVDIASETRQVMENIGTLLQAAGLDHSHLVKCTIFMTDMAYYATVNEVYASFFVGTLPPAREAVAVRELPRGARVEISGIAVHP